MKLLELIPRSAYIAVRGGALRVADGVRFDYADFASWCAEAFFARTGLPDGGVPPHSHGDGRGDQGGVGARRYLGAHDAI